MMTTEKPRTRFLVRIFDFITKKWTSFRVYENETKIALKDYKKRLEDKSNMR